MRSKPGAGFETRRWLECANLYEPVGGFSGVIAVETTCDGWLVSRLGGAYFGVFFLGFLASRLRRSLFPMSIACHE